MNTTEQQRVIMTTEEFQQLEKLLGKLRRYLGAPYCIVPEVVQDGYNIGIYDKYGIHVRDRSAATLEQAAKLCLNPSNTVHNK